MTLADPAQLVDVGADADHRPRPRGAGAARVASAPPATAARRSRGTFNEAPRARHQRGGLPLPRRSRASTAAVPRPRHARAVARPAARTIVEVLAAHGVDVVRRRRPTARRRRRSISHAILTHNRGGGRAPPTASSSRPRTTRPSDGGFKYNPPHGGPADTDVTGWIEREANALLEGGLADVAAPDGEAARADAGATTTSPPTSTTSPAVIDLDAIREAGLRLGVDPLGGASVAYWQAIAERHGLDLDGRQRRARPDVPLRAARLGRQDPHGLLVALRDGAAARAAPTASTSRSPTTPTPTATGSSRRRPGC